MKTFTANFQTENDKNTGSEPRWVLEILNPGAATTLFYSDERITISGQDYLPRVLSWGKIKNQISPGEKVVRIGSTKISLSNNPILDDSIDAGHIITIFQIYKTLATADKVPIFKGVVSDNIKSTLLIKFDFTCKDIGFLHNKFIGNVLRRDIFSDIEDDDAGKMIPIAYGSVKNVIPVSIQRGIFNKSATDFNPGLPTQVILQDGSNFPDPSPSTISVFGHGTLFFSYSGKSGNDTLTGVVFFNATRYKEDEIMWIGTLSISGSKFKYLLADHVSKAVTNIRVRIPGHEDKIELTENNFDFNPSVNLNDSGRTTVEIQQSYFFDGITYHARECKIIADIDGIKDDGSGTITGTPDALIEDPGHVITHLLLNHSNAGLVIGDIDVAGSFAELENLRHGIYKFAFYLKGINSLNEILALLAFQTWARFVWEVGIAKLLPIQNVWSLSFDDTTGNLVTCGNDASLDTGTSASIEVWYQPPTAGWGSAINERMLVTKGNAAAFLTASTSTGYTIAVDRTDNKIKIGFSGSATILSSTAALTANVFNYVVVNIQPTQIEIFINGSSDSIHVVTVGNLNTTNNLDIGDLSLSTGREIKGEIGKVAIHSTLLTGPQITSNFANPYQQDPIASVVSLPFQDGHGNDLDLLDVSGNGNDGAMLFFPTNVDLWKPGILSIFDKTFNTNSDVVLDSKNMLDLSREETRLADIKTKVTAKYNLDNSKFDRTDEDGYQDNVESEANFYSDSTRFGERLETLLLFALTDELPARDIKNKYLAFWKNTKTKFMFPTFLDNLDVERGDIYKFTNSEYGITGQNYEVLTTEYVNGNGMRKAIPMIKTEIIEV